MFHEHKIDTNFRKTIKGEYNDRTGKLKRLQNIRKCCKKPFEIKEDILSVPLLVPKPQRSDAFPAKLTFAKLIISIKIIETIH